MFILLNGAFGIGKTTTARALVQEAAGAAIYDPEPVGIALQRASAVFGVGGRIADFQDLATWRRMTAWGARWRHRRADAVIVPMAFTNLGYFDALATTLSLTAPVHRLCLVAPLEMVRARLTKRALAEGTPVDDWAFRRAEACCRAHRLPGFGRPIDATSTTEEIVRTVFALGVLDQRR